MSLCFIEPQDAIRVIADSVGREARRQILGEVVGAWVDQIPSHTFYGTIKGGRRPRQHDLSLLAACHASREPGHPVPSKEFLVKVFPSLGENRREVCGSPPASAGRRRLTRASGRTEPSTRRRPGCRKSAASSLPASA